MKYVTINVKYESVAKKGNLSYKSFREKKVMANNFGDVLTSL